MTIQGKPGEYLVQVDGPDAEHDVQNVTFQDVSIQGLKLTDGSAGARIGPNAINIQFVTEEK